MAERFQIAERTGMSLLAAPVACVPLSLAAIVIVTQFCRLPDVTVWLNSVVQFQFFGLGAIFAFALRRQQRRAFLLPHADIILSDISGAVWWDL